MSPLPFRVPSPRPDLHPAGPDLGGLRRIHFVFIAGAVVSAALCARMILRDARRQRTVARPPAVCTCMGACLRH